MSELDQQELIKLLRTGFSSFRNDFYWDWKYKNNPYFDSSLVLVAEKNGKIVGCNHWLLRELKLSNKLNIRTALAGDLLVHPEHRGHGIAAELLRLMRSPENISQKNIALSSMFAPLKLNNRLYEPVGGYIAAPNSTCTYKKLLSCQQLKERISLIDCQIKQNEELMEKLQHLQMSVLFKLTGTPHFMLSFSSAGVSIDERSTTCPDIIIEGSLPLSSSIIDGKIGLKSLVWAWITRKLKIQKGFSKIFRLQKAFRLLQSAN